MGRKSVWYCKACGVYLCAFCWDSFHKNEVPNLSPCTEKKLGLTGRRVLRYDSSQKEAESPLRAKRETCKSPPSKEDSAARTIGERLNKRAAGKPDELLATTPKKLRTSPGRIPNPLAVCPEARRHLARKRKKSREQALKPTHAMSVIGKKRSKRQAESGGK